MMYQRKASLFTRITALTLLFALLLTSTVLAATPPTPPDITADSAIVMDYDTGEVLYEKDADTMRVPASMTKVMTAYIIFEELEAGRLTLDTMVPVSNTNADRSRSSNSLLVSASCPYRVSRKWCISFRPKPYPSTSIRLP